MILHLLIDDKFADYAMTQFDTVAPGQNKYVVITYINNFKCKFITRRDEVEVVYAFDKRFEELCSQLYQFSAIIIHNLSTLNQVKAINAAPPSLKIAWVFWGAEVYSRETLISNYMGPETRYVYNKYLFRQSVKKLLRFITAKRKYHHRFEIPVEAFRRIDYCMTDMYEDYISAKEILNTKFDWLWYNYYTIEETLGNLKDSYTLGNNILVGNSASVTNNDLEAIDLLKQFDLGDRKVIMPLSYGDNYYRNPVLKKGYSILGNNFLPLTEYLDREEYNKHVLSCSSLLLNHYRPQAFGNIITALWLGSRVYLSNRNIIYKYFTRLGVHIFSIEEHLNSGNPNALNALDKESIAHNREILLREYRKDNVLKKVKELTDVLLRKN